MDTESISTVRVRFPAVETIWLLDRHRVMRLYCPDDLVAAWHRAACHSQAWVTDIREAAAAATMFAGLGLAHTALSGCTAFWYWLAGERYGRWRGVDFLEAVGQLWHTDTKGITIRRPERAFSHADMAEIRMEREAQFMVSSFDDPVLPRPDETVLLRAAQLLGIGRGDLEQVRFINDDVTPGLPDAPAWHQGRVSWNLAQYINSTNWEAAFLLRLYDALEEVFDVADRHDRFDELTFVGQETVNELIALGMGPDNGLEPTNGRSRAGVVLKGTEAAEALDIVNVMKKLGPPPRAEQR